MNAIILCGGLSTRLGEMTRQIPKVLLPIGDRPVLDWQLGALRSLGISVVVLAAGHLSHVLQEQVGEDRHGMRIMYAIEPSRLGTGGAIKFGLLSVPDPDAPTIILNGDILTTVPYAAMVQNMPAESDGIILGVQVPDAASYGTLQYNDQYQLTAFLEKTGRAEPGYINGGVYIFQPKIQKYFPPAEVFSIEYDVFPRVLSLFVHESREPWVDVGVPERLAWARENWQIFSPARV